MSNKIPTKRPSINIEDAYVSMAGASHSNGLKAYSKMIDEAVTVDRASASSSSRGRDFSGLTQYVSGKPGLLEADIDWFRPEEARPTKPKQITAFGRSSYKRIGILKNAIDAMGDFTCQGIRMSHSVQSIQKFYQEWFAHVQGPAISERLANAIFREANAVIRMRTAKINKAVQKKMQRAVAAEYPEDIRVTKNKKVVANEIPWYYHMVDTLLLDLVGGSVSNYSYAKPSFALTLTSQMRQELKYLLASTLPEHLEITNKMLPEIIAAFNSGKPVLLDQQKTYAFYYKKDEQSEWAEPISYSAYTDLLLYEKLKLADRAALDGATNKIRVWKIGNFEYKVAPSPAASAALAGMLGANTGGGCIDIIWGPDIELIETDTNLKDFLGGEKYEPTLMAIYGCLGIPQTLTGSVGASGTTNNYMSLKLLTERLNYVRAMIVEFWNSQARIVQEAKGFSKPAVVEFDYMNFEDPSAIATLLTALVDRNVLSEEFVHRFIHANTDLEEARVSRESKKREAGKKQDKSGPYHTADQDYNLKKIALQSGAVSPSQVGLDLPDKKPSEKTQMDMQELQIKTKKETTVKDKTFKGPTGRPKNAKDSEKRKTRVFRPKSTAAMIAWANIVQEKIAEYITPVILVSFGKKNVRSLTATQAAALERTKFEILCTLEYGDPITEQSIAEAIINKGAAAQIHSDIYNIKLELEAAIKREATVAEVRELQAAYFAEYKLGDQQ